MRPNRLVVDVDGNLRSVSHEQWERIRETVRTVAESPYELTVYPPRRDPLPVPQVQPYRCPVCDGRGHVPGGFYSPANTTGSANPELCRSCGGQGVVWR